MSVHSRYLLNDISCSKQSLLYMQCTVPLRNFFCNRKSFEIKSENQLFTHCFRWRREDGRLIRGSSGKHGATKKWLFPVKAVPLYSKQFRYTWCHKKNVPEYNFHTVYMYTMPHNISFRKLVLSDKSSNSLYYTSIH